MAGATLEFDAAGALAVINEAVASLTKAICDGEDGATSLVRLEDEPAGSNCPYGGTQIQTGVDEGLGRGDRRGPIGGGHALGRHGVGIEQGREVELAHVGGDPRMIAAHDADAGHAELERGGVRHGINPCRRRRRR